MSVTSKILSKIKEYNKICIYGHIRPDGDCYGSQFGLKDIIKSTFPEKEVYVVGETSNYVSFVGTPDVVKDEVCQQALSIVVDTGVAKRCGDPRYITGKEIVKIDHHISRDNYGDINWVIEEKPSCSEMVYDFYKKQKLKLSKRGAIALYVGIYTDTGGFRYRGVSGYTMQVAGALINSGAEVEYICNELSRTTLNEIELKGYLFNNFVKTKHFIYAKLPLSVYTQYGVSSEDAASLVNQLAGIDGYPVWAIIIEYPGEYRVRLRSSGVPINMIGEKYRGGGHEFAAGATLDSFGECEAFAEDVNEHVERFLENGIV